MASLRSRKTDPDGIGNLLASAAVAADGEMANRFDLELRCDALGSAELVLVRATVVEEISRSSRAEVTVVSSSELDLASALGAPAVLVVLLDGSPARFFHFLVRAVRFAGIDGSGLQYVLELAHELTRLEIKADVRMFQELDTQQIVDDVLDRGALTNTTRHWSVHRSLPVRVYCVQYRESDHAFFSRLLEHEGIFYFVADEEGTSNLHIADAQSAFLPIDGITEWPLVGEHTSGVGIRRLRLTSRVTAESASVGDYNFETPAVDLNLTHSLPGQAVGDDYEYTAGHLTPEEGQALAEIRAQEIAAERSLGSGVSNIATLGAGRWFELAGAARDALNKKWLLRRVEHQWSLRPRGDDEEKGYTNRFECMDRGVPYRPPRRTPLPRLRGNHSVVVTGPSGSEIHTDEYGRMKGKFFWDRLGADDDTSSRWMRTLQLPIGGSMALARVGWEMSVIYWDGDPDRPIGAQRLYNGEKTSPYGYPSAGTRMALQTPTSPGGGKSNEYRMEDGGGGMEFFVNASKDFDGQTNNNRTEQIGVNETQEVGVNSTLEVGANQDVTIGGDRSLTVGANATTMISGDRSKTVGASETVTVSGAINATIEGSDSETTAGSHTALAALGIDRTATSAQALTVGGSMLSAAGLGVGVAVAGAKAETIGGAKVAASGKSVTESVIGAYACTVGGVCVQAAGGNRLASTKGATAVTVGGLINANAGSKFTMKGSKVSINVLGVANLLGGGGIVNLTPASASFVGMVTLDASGAIKVSGSPNLLG